jgi:hypothetical protein
MTGTDLDFMAAGAAQLLDPLQGGKPRSKTTLGGL